MARVGYLGPPGTFSFEVARAGAGPGDELVALRTNHDVVLAVQAGDVDRAVSPVENLIDGAVTAVLDALAFEAPDVSIVGEAVTAVHHVLAAGGPLELADVRSVTSHPVALAQCGNFLRERLPGVSTAMATSTAEAIRGAATGYLGPRAAAIGTRAAAVEYGATILVEDIEDDADNRTRFAWLARTDGAPAAREELAVLAGIGAGAAATVKTTVLFHGDGDGRPGWLVRCLSEFAFRGVNLTRIESRPLRSQLGHYIFHVDCDGDAAAEPVAGAITALSPHCRAVRVLGSYAASPASLPDRDGSSPNSDTI